MSDQIEKNNSKFQILNCTSRVIILYQLIFSTKIDSYHPNSYIKYFLLFQQYSAQIPLKKQQNNQSQIQFVRLLNIFKAKYKVQPPENQIQAMIPQQLKQMFGLSSKQDQKMANNIWKMLDQMADSSPQQYKEFVSKNIKQGVTDVKQKKDQKQKPFKIKPQKGFLLEFDVILNQKYLPKQQIEQNQTKMTQRLTEKLDLSKQKWLDQKKKFKYKIHILLNVCFSDRIKLPLNKNKKQLLHLTLDRIKQIQIFYYSLQGPKEVTRQKSQILQTDYCMILNKNMYESLMRSDMNGKKLLMSLTISYFEQRLQTDANPLIKLYNPQLYGKLAFYAVEKTSIRLNMEKNYFFNNSSEVEEFLLERQIDIKRQKQLQQEGQKIKIKAKAQSMEKSAEIKFKPEQKKQQQISLAQKGGNDQMNCSQNSEKSGFGKKQKKLLIQVLNQTEIGSQTVEEFPYELKQTEQGYHIQILTPSIKSIEELDLQISDKKVKLKSISCQRFTQIDLKLPINSELVKAKLKKKLNRLIIDAPFLNKQSF